MLEVEVGIGYEIKNQLVIQKMLLAIQYLYHLYPQTSRNAKKTANLYNIYSSSRHLNFLMASKLANLRYSF